MNQNNSNSQQLKEQRSQENKIEKSKMDCAKCTKTIAESDEYFECDGCWAVHHLKCVGVKKTEVSARKGSKFLKLFCEKCYSDSGQVMKDNIQTILKYVCKIDMKTQQQEEYNKSVEILLKKICDEKGNDSKNNMREIMREQIETLKGHIDERGAQLQAEILDKTKELGMSGVNGNKQSYASVVNAGAKAIIVRPKNKEDNSEKTKQMLMTAVDPTVSGISELKSLSNGSVMIRCKTNEAMALIEKQVKEKEGENYIMSESKRRESTKVKLVGMTKKYSNEELTSLIRKQHLDGADEYVSVVKVYAHKNTRKECFNAIVNFDTNAAENILHVGQISIGWDMCKAYGYVRINRCYKCLGFNHLAKNCKNKIACCKCGGEHKAEECKSEVMSCINCVEYAKKNKENIDTKHHAFAHKCWSTQQVANKLNKIKNNME